MSFNISGPVPSRKPVIREAQSMENNGGGGNLGYMKQEKKKEKEDEFEAELQIFEEDSENADSFKKASNSKKEDNTKNKPTILEKVKKFLNGEKEN